jgi:uncharacterized membrane protein
MLPAPYSLIKDEAAELAEPSTSRRASPLLSIKKPTYPADRSVFFTAEVNPYWMTTRWMI